VTVSLILFITLKLAVTADTHHNFVVGVLLLIIGRRRLDLIIIRGSGGAVVGSDGAVFVSDGGAVVVSVRRRRRLNLIIRGSGRRVVDNNDTLWSIIVLFHTLEESLNGSQNLFLKLFVISGNGGAVVGGDGAVWSIILYHTVEESLNGSQNQFTSKLLTTLRSRI
jgi:hypothetical protein